MLGTDTPAITTGSPYPMTSRINELGHLEVGGCDIVDLAARFDTPLYVYDEETLRSLCRDYVAEFSTLTDAATIIYAGKSFLCRAMCELVADEGLSLDVSSGGELWMARAAGFPAERIYCHGNNKGAAELALALDMGVGRVIVDSFHEISLLESIAREHSMRQRVLLRVAPGVTPQTHRHIQTGQSGSKFGFPLRDAADAVQATLACPHLDLVGVHCHIGSQIFDLSAHAQAIRVLVGQVAEWRRRFHVECSEVDVGGGLAIDYVDADRAPSIEEFAGVVTETLRSESERHAYPLPRLLVEPGRSISGRAGLTAYRVGSLKSVPDAPLYVAIDGGMSDNIRPMLYGAEYQAIVADRAAAATTVQARVIGKHCDGGDVLIQSVRLASPRPGDVLATLGTGAYAYSLANNYNGQPRPAVVFVRDGRAHVVVERETWADVARLHQPLDGHG